MSDDDLERLPAEQPAGNNFVSLAAAIEPWLDKSWADLPKTIQGFFKRRFPAYVDSISGDPRQPLKAQLAARRKFDNHKPHPAWDSFSPNQRRAVAEQSDFDRDPTNESLMTSGGASHR